MLSTMFRSLASEATRQCRPLPINPLAGGIAGIRRNITQSGAAAEAHLLRPAAVAATRPATTTWQSWQSLPPLLLHRAASAATRPTTTTLRSLPLCHSGSAPFSSAAAAAALEEEEAEPPAAAASSNVNGTKAAAGQKKKKKSRPRLNPIIVTERAAERIQELLSGPNAEGAIGIRLGVKRRGCNGLSYTLNYAFEKPEKDEEMEGPMGVKVFIEPMALFNVVGTVMDWEETELSSEFTFNNPNSKGECGCGESFNV